MLKAQNDTQQYFYPRPLRGGRLINGQCPQVDCVFLSTPSARRATEVHRQARQGRQDFYPRPLRGGRRSYHRFYNRPAGFLSTPSARRATCLKMRSPSGHLDFYPRPLRGGRHVILLVQFIRDRFLSTPSARRATVHRAGCRRKNAYFYPRPLRGGRQPYRPPYLPPYPISIHALCEEGDPIIHRLWIKPTQFLSTPSARRATCPVSSRTSAFSYFYPRPLRGGRLYS